MTYAKKVANNTIIQLVGRGISTFLSFYIVAMLARRLGVEGFGSYSIVFAYLGLFAVLADFGFFYLLVRKLSAHEGDGVEIASNLIAMRTVAAIVIFGLSIGIVQFFPYPHAVKQAIAFATLFFTLISLQNTLFGVFQAHYQMHWAVVGDVSSRVVTIIVLYLFLGSSNNLLLIMGAYLAGSTVATVILVLRARRLIPFTFGTNFKLWLSILKESIPFGLAIVFSYMYFKVDALILSIMKGPFDVGIYAPAVKILEVVLIIPSMFIATILPIYSKYHADRDARLPDTIQKTFDLLSLAMVAVVGGIFATAPQIVQLIAGDDFMTASSVAIGSFGATAVTALSIIIFTAVFSYLNPTFSYLLIAAGKQSKLLLPNIILLIVNVGANIVLIPRFSYIATASTTVITDIIALGIMYFLAKREINFTLSLDKCIRCAIAGVIMVITLRWLALPLLPSIALGGILYLGCAYLFGGIRSEMITLLRRNRG